MAENLLKKFQHNHNDLDSFEHFDFFILGPKFKSLGKLMICFFKISANLPYLTQEDKISLDLKE